MPKPADGIRPGRQAAHMLYYNIQLASPGRRFGKIDLIDQKNLNDRPND